MNIKAYFMKLVYEDPAPTVDERVDELERENEYLRSKLAAMERQLNAQSSPTRKPRIQPVANQVNSSVYRLPRGGSSDVENMIERVTAFKVHETYKSPVKPKAALVSGWGSVRNSRRVTSRKKDLGPGDGF